MRQAKKTKLYMLMTFEQTSNAFTSTANYFIGLVSIA